MTHSMFSEFDVVALTHDLSDGVLRTGAWGTVVYRHPDATAYDVEFVTPEGRTLALRTLTASDFRLVDPDEMSHREVSC